MRTAWYVIAFALAAASAVHAQALSPMRYLGEVGDLGTESDPRKSVDFGTAKASATEHGVLFHGSDDHASPWRAGVPVIGGVGWTDVWRADFDANGRQDLMIAATFPANGRCLSPVTITFLMFDSQGRPVPWTIDTFLLNIAGVGKMPAILRDINRNRRPELIATGCEYSNPPRAGEDRRIQGIYEAENAGWKLIRPKELQPYSDVVRASHRGRFTEFLPAEPESWHDFGNSTAVPPNGPVTITDVFRPDPECREVVRLEVVDGQVRKPTKDPCEIVGENRIEVSDGRICLGWPTVVVDGNGGREIIADPALIESKLREIAAARWPVTLVGQSNPLRCSPTQLWVSQEK
jgi:hypothetical protein